MYAALGWAAAWVLGCKAYARVAGISLATGFAIGSFGGHARAEPESLLILRGLGSLAGLGFLAAAMFFSKTRWLI